MVQALCKWIILLYAGLYLLALVIFVVGVFGLFGQDKDPLSADYLVPLGLPRVLFFDGMPEMSLPWLGAPAPLLNIAILVALCRVIHRPLDLNSGCCSRDASI
jgi:hypothetical protein